MTHFIGDILCIKGHNYTIVETEYYGDTDPYTQRDKQQLQSETFYFHRVNVKAFKEGSFKGMDITVGDPVGLKHRAYLIRSIQDSEGKVTEGPCLVVDTILRHHGVTSVKEFYAAYQATNPLMGIRDAASSLYVTPRTLAAAPKTYPRVGLRFKAISGYDHLTVLRALVSQQRYVAPHISVKKGRYGGGYPSSHRHSKDYGGTDDTLGTI